MMNFSTSNSTMEQNPTAIKPILKKSKRSTNCVKKLFCNKVHEVKPSVQFKKTYEVLYYDAALPIKPLPESVSNTKESAAPPKPTATKCKWGENMEAVTIEEVLLAEIVQKNTEYNASISRRWKI